MEKDTRTKLIDLNRQFYQTFARQFSQTRMRLQPGVKKIITRIQQNADILDLGCGNGELARVLTKLGHIGKYIGLDFSADLLSFGRGSGPFAMPVTFAQADLTTAEWVLAIPDQLTSAGTRARPCFDFVFAFAVLHHIPSNDLRKELLLSVHHLLKPGGQFVHSVWQFLNSPRLEKRIQPWKNIGLTNQQVDSGDYLLDWRRGGYGLRYVHHFTLDELTSLASASNFTIKETFFLDGEGGQLGLYQIWNPI